MGLAAGQNRAWCKHHVSTRLMVARAAMRPERRPCGRYVGYLHGIRGLSAEVTSRPHNLGVCVCPGRKTRTSSSAGRRIALAVRPAESLTGIALLRAVVAARRRVVASAAASESGNNRRAAQLPRRGLERQQLAAAGPISNWRSWYWPPLAVTTGTFKGRSSFSSSSWISNWVFRNLSPCPLATISPTPLAPLTYLWLLCSHLSCQGHTGLLACRYSR